MLNEVLFMEIRILREYCERYKITMRAASEIFEKYKIWEYIEDCYASLHTSGDEYVFNEIDMVLKHDGVDLQGVALA